VFDLEIVTTFVLAREIFVATVVVTQLLRDFDQQIDTTMSKTVIVVA
jgi:hypothetical protein